MPWLLANRWALYAAGIIAVILAAWAWLGIHDRGIRTAQETLDAAKSAQALADYQAQQKAHSEAENARVSEVIKDYERQIHTPSPIVAELGQRLHKYTLSSCKLPTAPANTEGTGSSPGEPGSSSQFESAIEALAVAAIHDANQVEALRSAWPK